MHINLVGVLAPTELRLRPQFLVKVVFAQIKLDNRRAVFNGRADESILVPLRDSRLKLHLHCNCHPIPFVTIDLPVDKPTVCLSNNSSRIRPINSFQRTSRVARPSARRRKDASRVGLASRGMMKR